MYHIIFNLFHKMKILHYIPLTYARLSLLVAILIATTATTAAAVTTKDVTGTIGYTKVTGEEEWNITGDLSLTDCIEVAEGAKLTIKNATAAPVTIRHADGNVKSFFYNYGELHLGDNASERIILDGGSNFDWDINTHKLTPDASTKEKKAVLIRQRGLLYMNNVTITDFCAKAYLPAMLCQTRKKTFIDNCLFKECFGEQVACIIVNSEDSNLNPDDTAISIKNTTFRHCEGGEKYNDDLGLGYCYSGIIRNIGLATSNISLENVEIKENYLAGGGIICNLSFRGTLTVDGCTISDNRVGTYGAGIWTEGSFEATGNPTIIENNYAKSGGAGFTITTYGGGAWKLYGTRTYEFNNKLIIRNNTTDGVGGGVCVLFNEKTNLEDGTIFDIKFNGATIENNSAAVSGGGIYFNNSVPSEKNYTFTTHLDGGNIKGNTAPIGAGIYARNIDISHSNLETVCTIDGNKASKGGAGIYINGANISLNKADVSSNEATTNGGGIYLESGALSMVSGDIHGNTCKQNGGGVYISNTATEEKNSTFSGGKIYANTAKNGGGICADGNVAFTISNSSIYNNTANNGGGICVINGAKMTYENGLIRNNKAISENAYPTGFQKSESEIEGFGGGVFIAGSSSKSSSLTFSLSASTNFGLYGNGADNGGDDIFTNGYNTSVSIPDVSKMKLSEFNVPVSENALFWAEDYQTNDTHYGDGTKINESWTGKNDRYRYTLNNMIVPYKVGAPQTLTKYTSVALGYGVVFAKIVKEGLKYGESAIFTITKEGDSEPYMRILLTGNSDNSETSQTVALVPGKWTVEETKWSWAYSSDKTKETIELLNNDNPSKNIFTFTNKPKSDTPPHSEAIKKNSF